MNSSFFLALFVFIVLTECSLINGRQIDNRIRGHRYDHETINRKNSKYSLISGNLMQFCPLYQTFKFPSKDEYKMTYYRSRSSGEIYADFLSSEYFYSQKTDEIGDQLYTMKINNPKYLEDNSIIINGENSFYLLEKGLFTGEVCNGYRWGCPSHSYNIGYTGSNYTEECEYVPENKEAYNSFMKLIQRSFPVDHFEPTIPFESRINLDLRMVNEKRFGDIISPTEYSTTVILNNNLCLIDQHDNSIKLFVMKNIKLTDGPLNIKYFDSDEYYYYEFDGTVQRSEPNCKKDDENKNVDDLDTCNYYFNIAGVSNNLVLGNKFSNFKLDQSFYVPKNMKESFPEYSFCYDEVQNNVNFANDSSMNNVKILLSIILIYIFML